MSDNVIVSREPLMQGWFLGQHHQWRNEIIISVEDIEHDGVLPVKNLKSSIPNNNVYS